MKRRLVNLLREQIAQPVERLVDAVVRSVQQHSGPEQSDDLTLVVLRRRESAIH